MLHAVVLTGGLGTRLGDATRSIPKAALDVDGIPLVAYTLWALAQQGVTDAHLNLHHLPQVLVNALSGVPLPGLHLHFTTEDHLRGTAGTALDFVHRVGPAGAFLVVYGDLLLNQPLAPFLAQHHRTGAALTALVHPTRGSNSVVEFDGEGRMTRFEERPATPPVPPLNGTLWANSGCYAVDPSALVGQPVDRPVDFPRDIFPGLLSQRRLFAHALGGYRCAVDSVERLEKARADMRSGAMRRPGQT